MSGKLVYYNVPLKRDRRPWKVDSEQLHTHTQSSPLDSPTTGPGQSEKGSLVVEGLCVSSKILRERDVLY